VSLNTLNRWRRAPGGFIPLTTVARRRAVSGLMSPTTGLARSAMLVTGGCARRICTAVSCDSVSLGLALPATTAWPVGHEPGNLVHRPHRRGVATGGASSSQAGARMAPVTHKLDLTTTVNQVKPLKRPPTIAKVFAHKRTKTGHSCLGLLSF